MPLVLLRRGFRTSRSRDGPTREIAAVLEPEATRAFALLEPVLEPVLADYAQA
ncbi:hypothetical protein [Streptomyces violaceusniger]|uniref:hypothetical protein n=1 Tax=Streptomyces violaceusniger TaxID=68280 RepID=UPI0031D689CD